VHLSSSTPSRHVTVVGGGDETSKEAALNTAPVAAMRVKDHLHGFVRSRPRNWLSPAASQVLR
jgi:hypothetical protein